MNANEKTPNKDYDNKANTSVLIRGDSFPPFMVTLISGSTLHAGQDPIYGLVFRVYETVSNIIDERK